VPADEGSSPTGWRERRCISLTISSSQHVPDRVAIAAQEHAKRAREVAACGGHSLALTGAPGNGKSVLARALAGLLPPLPGGAPRPLIEEQEARAWVEEALRGQSGQLVRAQHGVLLLDRLDCFVYSPLQRQRLGTVLDRVRDAQLVLTLQPCPCGFYGDPLREGWKRQQGRFAGLSLTRNAEMDHAQILHWCSLDASAQKLSRAACQQLRFSVRTMDAMLTVARTVADLAGSEQIQANHLAEAIQYQPRPDQF
jgi:magnesium chelatase family protein